MQRETPPEVIEAIAKAISAVKWSNISAIVDVVEEIELLAMQYEKQPITKTNAVYKNAMGMVYRRCGEQGRPIVEALNGFVTHDT